MLERETVRPPGIYAVADVEVLGRRALCEAVQRMVGGGVRWIQVRAKNSLDDDLVEDLAACFRALSDSGAEIWLNDRPDLARIYPVRGVHLGQEDLPPAAARSVVGAAKMIGRSTHNEAQVRAADSDDAVDLVAIGPVYPTTSKPGAAPVVGIEGLRRARRLTSKPLVAIGGIGEHNLTRVLEAGVDSAAMLGAICRGGIGAIDSNCRRLVARAEAAV